MEVRVIVAAMRPRFARVFAALILLAALAAEAHSADELAIGIIQFPSTFHPSIEAMVAKSYVLGMVRRPLTTYDASWHLICMLCVTLPSIENGLAQILDLPDGKRGIRLTYTIRPDAVWGDGVPVTTDDRSEERRVGKECRSR